MPPKRRQLGQLPYRKLYVIAAEGAKTEPQYFDLFKYSESISVNFIRGHNESSPLQVLKRMSKCLKDMSLKKTDEAWLVVDKDEWTNEQLSQLHEWSLGKPNYGFALSNPRFEYWLLLHFDEGTGISNS